MLRPEGFVEIKGLVGAWGLWWSLGDLVELQGVAGASWLSSFAGSLGVLVELQGFAGALGHYWRLRTLLEL